MVSFKVAKKEIGDVDLIGKVLIELFFSFIKLDLLHVRCVTLYIPEK